MFFYTDPILTLGDPILTKRYLETIFELSFVKLFC